MRQEFGAAVRWNYISVNPAVAAGRNPQPQSEELHPFTLAEIDRLHAELGDLYGPLVVFAAETGLRTNEWVALERRDVDRAGQAVTVQRRYADGVLTGYPKTKRSRRRVPLTRRALDELERIPARLDTPLLFPAPKGGYIGPTRGGHASGTRRSRLPDRATRAVPSATHVRDRGACRWRLDLRAGAADGHSTGDDRPHLRPPGARLRGRDSGPARREGRTFWR
jgi:integrase